MYTHTFGYICICMCIYVYIMLLIVIMLIDTINRNNMIMYGIMYDICDMMVE